MRYLKGYMRCWGDQEALNGNDLVFYRHSPSLKLDYSLSTQAELWRCPQLPQTTTYGETVGSFWFTSHQGHNFDFRMKYIRFWKCSGWLCGKASSLMVPDCWVIERAADIYLILPRSSSLNSINHLLWMNYFNVTPRNFILTSQADSVWRTTHPKISIKIIAILAIP